jgi:hypothetical protein
MEDGTVCTATDNSRDLMYISALLIFDKNIQYCTLAALDYFDRFAEDGFYFRDDFDLFAPRACCFCNHAVVCWWFQGDVEVF